MLGRAAGPTRLGACCTREMISRGIGRGHLSSVAPNAPAAPKFGRRARAQRTVRRRDEDPTARARV
jgi:hypothetical protein